MTTRKFRAPPVAQPPAIKSVAYPPAAIWKTKEEGADFSYRGNTFVRRGDRVARVFSEVTETAASPRDSKGAAD